MDKKIAVPNIVIINILHVNWYTFIWRKQAAKKGSSDIACLHAEEDGRGIWKKRARCEAYWGSYQTIQKLFALQILLCRVEVSGLPRTSGGLRGIGAHGATPQAMVARHASRVTGIQLLRRFLVRRYFFAWVLTWENLINSPNCLFSVSVLCTFSQQYLSHLKSL